MPRTTSSHITSAFSRVQKQARGLLVGVRREIRSKEADLLRLKKEESQLSAIAGLTVDTVRFVGFRWICRCDGRISWCKLLEQLPKQFKASQICTVRGLKNKRPSEIFAAITRWMEAGAVKRKKRGLYERIQQKPKKPA